MKVWLKSPRYHEFCNWWPWPLKISWYIFVADHIAIIFIKLWINRQTYSEIKARYSQWSRRAQYRTLSSCTSCLSYACVTCLGAWFYMVLCQMIWCGLMVPLLKDKTGDVSSLNNYRGITLIPTISKVFELTLLDICEQYLITDDLQFGFKKGLGCADAIFTLRATIE